MTARLENLATYLQRTCIEATREAISGGHGDAGEAIAQAISARVQRPDVRLRVERASPHERVAATAMIQGFAAELQEMEAPPAPPPADSPLAIEGLGGRVEAATPEAMRGLLDAAAHGAIEAADDALRASTPQGAEPPSQTELAAWMATGGAEAARDNAAGRLAALWDLEEGAVTITGWAFGGLVGRVNGAEYHAPATDVLARSEAKRVKNPLAALVRGWMPRLVPARDRSKTPVLPASLAMVLEGDRRAKIFSLAAHVDRHGQAVNRQGL